MNLLFIFSSSLFFLWIFREIFSYLWQWQNNDYRPYRFFASLKGRKYKGRPFFVFLAGVKWFLFLGFGYVILNDNYLQLYQYCIFVLFFIQAFVVGREIYTNTLKKPRLTFRASITILLSFSIILTLFMFPLMENFFWLLLIDIFTPGIVSLFVLLLLLPTELFQDWQIDRANRKLKQHSNLLVIGITGSHGKSLAKEYLSHVLGKKFRVIKTDGKNNTAIGIAKTILRKLEKDSEIFVAEMSAYRKGEIGELSEFIHPRIGILTSITSNHVSLFNSLKNIQDTNYELVQSLPKNGICLFDGASNNTYQLYKKSRRQKRLYYFSTHSGRLKEDRRNRSDIVGFVSRKTRTHLFLSVELNNEHVEFIVPVHINGESLLPAVYVGYYLGMNIHDIQKALNSLPEK